MGGAWIGGNEWVGGYALYYYDCLSGRALGELNCN